MLSNDRGRFSNAITSENTNKISLLGNINENRVFLVDTIPMLPVPLALSMMSVKNCTIFNSPKMLTELC